MMDLRRCFGVVSVVGITLAGVGCDSPGTMTGDSMPPGGSPTQTVGSTTTTTVSGGTTTGGGATQNDLGPTCAGTSGITCIALKYVAFEDTSGNPVISQATAVQNIEAVNTVWSQCAIAFQMEDFVTVNPSDYGFSTSAATDADLTNMRQDFSTSTQFLAVSYTGTVPGADAWTEEGGSGTSGPYGSILDAATATYTPILAHELGHYLGLEHVADTTNLMDAIVYASPDTLTTSQCQTAVSTAQSNWQAMLR